ncbi:Svp26p [Rhodotorula paludigena]|uniref:Svp26p n=1 Tax=Rhodotorula paludigena TaxID=86838 RepID=UPI00317A709D
MLTVLHVLSWLACIAGFVFVLLSLASGLLYVAEVIEEHSALAKTIGQHLIYAEIALFCLLYFVDGLPWHLVAVGILAHLVYLQNFSRNWPTISLTSVTFIASCLFVLASHFLSFRHFSARTASGHSGRYTHYNAYDPKRGRYGVASHSESFLEVATFFAICVWLVPFYLFLSLSANDNVLPSAGESAAPSRRSSTAAKSGVPDSPTLRAQKIPGSPGLGRHSRQRSSMMKTALSSAFSLVPSSLRPSTLSVQLPLSEKPNAPRRDIPRSPSPTYGFQPHSPNLQQSTQGTSSAFSTSSASAVSAGVKARPQPLLRTSFGPGSNAGAWSQPGSPLASGSGGDGLGFSTVAAHSPVSPAAAPFSPSLASSYSALPSPGPNSSSAPRSRFAAQPPPGVSVSQPPSPAQARFAPPPGPPLSAGPGGGTRPSFAHSVTAPASVSAPGMARRSTGGGPVSPAIANGAVSPVEKGIGRRASEAVLRQSVGAGAGAGGLPSPSLSAGPGLKRRDTTSDWTS